MHEAFVAIKTEKSVSLCQTCARFPTYCADKLCWRWHNRFRKGINELAVKIFTDWAYSWTLLCDDVVQLCIVVKCAADQTNCRFF